MGEQKQLSQQSTDRIILQIYFLRLSKFDQDKHLIIVP